MKLDVVSVVVEVVEVSIQPRFYFGPLFGGRLGQISWESFRRLLLVVGDDRGRTRDVTPRPLVGDKLKVTGRADKSARCEVSIRAASGWASLTIVRKLPTHRAKVLGRLTLMSTFLLPTSDFGTAAMWRAANDKVQTRF